MSAKVEPKNFDGAGIFTAISLRGRTSLNSEGAARNFSILHRIHWVQRPPPQYDPVHSLSSSGMCFPKAGRAACLFAPSSCLIGTFLVEP